MSFIKYINDEGYVSYLRNDGIINIDISCHKGLCFLNLIALNKYAESTLPIIFTLDLEDNNHINLLTEENYISITQELIKQFTEKFEVSLKSENFILNLNHILQSVINSISLFARDMVTSCLKELYKKP